MLKNDLRENGFSVHDKITNSSVLNILWVTFALIMITVTTLLVVAVLLRSGSESPVSSSSGAIPLYMLAFIFFMFLSLALKFIFTWLFSADRLNSIKLKILEGKERPMIPVCHCREGLKVWQTVVIYLVPVGIVYTMMFLLSVTMVAYPFEEVEAGFLTMLLCMTFFMSFDLALVTYVLFIKIRDKIDYIAVNHHIYELTLYKSTYIRLAKRDLKKRIEALRQKRKTRIFTTITTCANPECVNHGQELEEDIKNCPLCGGRSYKAEIFAHVITCVNPDCPNYGYELKNEIKTCEICGAATGNLALKFRPDLIIPSVVTTWIISAVFMLIQWSIFDYSGPFISIINFIQYIVFAIGIGIGFISKNKWAFMFAIAAFLFVTFVYGFILNS